MTARRLGIPSSTTFDYEWAWLQHQLGCRAATRVVVPDVDPARAARALRHTAAEAPAVPRAEGGVLPLGLRARRRRCSSEWGIDPARVLVVLRPPPDVSLYHRHSNPLFPQTLEHVGTRRQRARVRDPAHRRAARLRPFARAAVGDRPRRAVDAQSLIAFADLVVSAGGTMNREAAALGVPVYTTYGGRLGGVDEELIREGRLRPLTDPRALELHKRDQEAPARAPRPAGDARPAALSSRRGLATAVAVALELRRPDTGDLRELTDRRRPRVCDLVQDAVVEDDVRRHAVARGPGRGATREASRRPASTLARRSRESGSTRHAELRRGTGSASRPGQPEHALRTRHADVEEAALLGDLRVRPRLPRRQLLLVEPRQEDRLELEPLRAMQREQVHAARAVAARIEAPPQLGDERRRVARRTTTASATSRARSVWRTSSRSPSLSGELRQPAGLERGAPHAPRPRLASTVRAGATIRRAASRSSSDAPWNGMPASCSSSSKSVSRAFVRARIATSSSGQSSERISLDDRRALVLRRGERRARPAPARPEAPAAASSRRRRAAGRAGSRTRAPAASSGSSPRAGRRSRAGSASGSPSRCSGPAPVNA